MEALGGTRMAQKRARVARSGERRLAETFCKIKRHRSGTLFINNSSSVTRCGAGV